MGVPAFFRWLSTKYPKIISQVKEEMPVEVDGETIPVDIQGPNPNEEEFDNLYLDMNGIVHPCTHPEDRPPPATEEEMMLEVFKYTERVVNMARPRKLLMMAVDGVAPRAKMNQQRSRRFRSAKEAQEAEEDKAELRKMLKQSGQAVESDDTSTPKKGFDSNVITPGTPFMDKLAVSLRYWVAYKINTDPGWQNLKVIISDATIPGEGEHKIMEFIRSQRRQPEHDPNTRHVIYGLDADLIMLALATHEPHFRVLREDVFAQDSKPRPCKLCGQVGHQAYECRGEAKEKQGEFDEKQKTPTQKPFIWLHVSVLREYLEVELSLPNQGFKFDLERAIDDWLFLCFFVGNDFLPHLPSLSIREEGIDTLVAVWKDNLHQTGGYVTKDGHLDLARARHILMGLAKQEDAIFKRRREIDVKREAGAKRRKLENERRQNRDSDRGRGSNGNYNSTNGPGRKRKVEETYDEALTFSPAEANSRRVRDLGDATFAKGKELFQAQLKNANDANKSAAAVIKEELLRRKAGEPQSTDASPPAVPALPTDSTDENLPTPPSGPGKRKADDLDVNEDEGTPGRSTPITPGRPAPDSDEAPPDNVRLWEDGYADRYYELKFHVDPKDISYRHKVAADYVEGLAWVLLYYMQGCPSWTWYYPYHYAPFAANFTEMDKLTISFEKGIPFRPFQQLMGVLPAASRHAIPEAFHSLMTDPDSEIIDFYPEDFAIDMNGKKQSWLGIVLLPFIDGPRLLEAMKKKYPLLSKEELARNEPGQEVLIFSTKHSMSEEVVTNFYSKKQGPPNYKLNAKTAQGLIGTISKLDNYLPQTSLLYPMENKSMPDLDDDQSMSVVFEMPVSTHVHKSQLLRGLVEPRRVLDSEDLELLRHRSRKSGRSFGGVPLHENRNGNGRGRGGSINYSNPFAAHLNPNHMPPGNPNRQFSPQGQGQNQPPYIPPHLAAQLAASGWIPPPPGNHFGRGGPPPPMNGGGYSGNHYGRGGGGNGGGNPGRGRGGSNYRQGNDRGGYNNGRYTDRYDGSGNRGGDSRGYDRYQRH